MKLKKYDDIGLSVDEKELVVALIAAATENYLSSIITWKDELRHDRLLVILKKVREVSDLYWMQKERNVK